VELAAAATVARVGSSVRRRYRVLHSLANSAQSVLLAWVCFSTPLAAQPVIADVRQGTNLTVAIAPDGATLVIDLLGQLWRLPVTGGGAEPLTEPGEQARNPRVSPDGGRVVYQRLVAGHWDLWLLDLATREQQPLTATADDERDPDFSTDGRAVVFATNRTGHYCLWSIALDGHVETQLTEEAGDASFPTVSQQGLIAYVLDRGSESALRVLGPDGAAMTLYTGEGHLTAPSWRPGSGVLVFAEQTAPLTNQLRILLLGDPRVVKPLIENEDVFASRAAWISATEFVYAADGQLWRRALAHPTRQPVHLFAAVAVNAFPPPSDMRPFDERGPRPVFGIAGAVRSRDGRRVAFTALGDLWMVERGEPERLTNDVYVELDPTFAPDGDSLVFASERSGQFELWRYTLRDRRFTQLTFGALKPHGPAISPDGKQIAFLEVDSLEPWAPARLQVLAAPGAQPVTLATGLLGATAPQWSQDGATLRIHASAAQTIDRPATRLHVELIRDLVPERPGIATGRGTAPTIAMQWQPPAPPDDFVLQVDRLFDGVHADYRRHVDVHVHAGRIAAISARGVTRPQGKVIALPDATVIPGLIDVHAHQNSLAGERLGRAWLAYGVTTVREVAADVPEALQRAEVWASGRVPGPHLIVTPAVSVPPESVPNDPRAPVRALPGIANGFAHTMAKQLDAGAMPNLTGAARQARVALESPLTPYELELSPGFSAYQDGFSRLLAAGAVFSPGLGVLAGLSGWPDGPQPWQRDGAYSALFTPVERAAWTRDGLAAALPALQNTVARLIRAGGRVAVGSDAPTVPYGLGLHLELALLAGAGLVNDQVLRLATAEGALALGIERDVGTLEEGKLADFVVLDGDPLARIADTLRIVAVVKDGVWYDRAALLQRP
jgi:Tol biopolymer transport system component